ncbi:glycoside hydrolase family 3 protein [Blastococcus sp. TF02A-30]|uniref:glycoside hydrolase family 3 protein n=1 Tax=Blastococcus sp. TF02A-30 TaxID=2250580 RepID=UPI000DEAE841|nr:glycoside hydrolase family 3 N-terminal domain-containing protein [Blastococcus sp. TF02A-30]RBY84470.1 glycoside hydrolase family 3 protein [Blastococcus sp. TF02A-30]
MSEIDALVNGCLMPGFAGTAVPEWVPDALGEGLSGVCLYGQNLAGAADGTARVAELTAAVRAARPDALVALDEEGGDVTRLEYLTGSRYPGNLALGVVDDEALTEAVARSIGRDLRRVGVAVDFAPSVDVNSDPRNPVIGVRSFGADPALVARHGAAAVRGLRAAGVAATAKHFPGHGATTVDSHLGLPVIDVDEAVFRGRELPPFTAAVAAGADLVMTSHVVFPALDDRPATLSRRILVDLLRGELGFAGVVVTDALDMAGVRAAHGIPEAGALALAAGADLLLVGAEDGEEHCAAIRAAVAAHLRAGTLTEERLREAAGRVTALRERLAAAAAPPAEDGDGIGAEAARRALRSRDLVPLPAPAVVVELRAEANMAVGEAKWSLAEPLDALGLMAEPVTVREPGPSAEDVLARAAGRPLVVAVRDACRSPWQETWLRALTGQRPDAVTVALGLPDDLRLVPGPALATHGAARACTDAAAEALRG